MSILQRGVEVAVSGATLTGATVGDQPVVVGQVSPTVALGQGATTVPVVVSEGPLSQRYELAFDRGAAPIVEATYAQASNAGANDLFGSSVAAGGDYAAIGAPGEDNSTAAAADEGAVDSGAVYIFRRVGSTWMQTQILKGQRPARRPERAAFGSGPCVRPGRHRLVGGGLPEGHQPPSTGARGLGHCVSG